MTLALLIKREIEIACIECAAWVKEIKELSGLCNNPESDYFGHVVTFQHLACGKRADGQEKQEREEKGAA